MENKKQDIIYTIAFFMLLPLITAAGISRLVRMRKDLRLPDFDPRKDMWE